MAETTPVPSDELEPTMRGSMSGVGDAPLGYARWEHPEPRGRVVIAHGYGEHGERYRHTAQWLYRQGWSVSAMDHRGFGRSGGTRGDARGIRGPVEDLALFLRQERTHDAGRLGPEGARAFPQVVLGHSFGGLVALLVLLWHPETLEALILSNPAVKMRELPLPLHILQTLFAWVAPHRPLNLPGDKTQVCSDPVMVQRYSEDPLCHHYVTAAFVAAIREGRRELLAFGAELDRPILLLEADRDCVIDPGASEALWSAVRPGLLQRQRMEGFYHEIFHDLGRAEAERLAGQWLDQLFPVGKGSPAVSSAMFE
jgi:alpha-beta hydrolase superfamily lysophospholipase